MTEMTLKSDALFRELAGATVFDRQALPTFLRDSFSTR